MTIGLWIAIVAIIIQSLTALYVGYENRRQMRQIEAHRSDPNVSLKPPPHGFSVSVRDHAILLSALISAFGLVISLRNRAPITRETVVAIATNVASIFFAVGADFAANLSRRAFEEFVKSETHIVRILEKHQQVLIAITEPHQQEENEKGPSNS